MVRHIHCYINMQIYKNKLLRETIDNLPRNFFSLTH